ncbi:MAG: hypothetical protein E6H03_00680 [Bacillati bacterium ANGP1]|uniref:Uncharacterized protein n=1 Tax=Candidatus Segetimicrobium genomatis TaxID=2569760 RepID=A0A537JPA8_9BACT|nr:MAG: hypothetical protein E6H03_00680 [Terrabacteria group bacterium ANGP1]
MVVDERRHEPFEDGVGVVPHRPDGARPVRVDRFFQAFRAQRMLAGEIKGDPVAAGPEFPEHGAIEEPAVGFPERVALPAIARRGLDPDGELQGAGVPERKL